MKRILLTGLVALVAVMAISDTAEARRMRRSRGGSNCCAQTSTCNSCGNGCQATWQGQDPNDPNYNSNVPAPHAQSYDNRAQGNTTFYRGQQNAPQQPQMAPNARLNNNGARMQNNTRVEGHTEATGAGTAVDGNVRGALQND